MKKLKQSVAQMKTMTIACYDDFWWPDVYSEDMLCFKNIKSRCLSKGQNYILKYSVWSWTKKCGRQMYLPAGWT